MQQHVHVWIEEVEGKVDSKNISRVDITKRTHKIYGVFCRIELYECKPFTFSSILTFSEIQYVYFFGSDVLLKLIVKHLTVGLNP